MSVRLVRKLQRSTYQKSIEFEKQMSPGFVMSTMDRPKKPVCPESWPCSCFCTSEETESSSYSCLESQSYLYYVDPTRNTPSIDHQSLTYLTGDNCTPSMPWGSLAYMMLLVFMKDLSEGTAAL